MSNQLERPWTEEEKYTLLTEILKNARVPSTVLFYAIRDRNISPSWPDIPLPPGRSLNSCRHAFQNMYQTVAAANQSQPPPPPPLPSQPSLPPLPSLPPSQLQPPRESWGPPPITPANPVPSQVLGMAIASASTQAQEGYNPRKRPLYPLEKTALTPRAIQPRPPLSAGQFSSESGSPGPMSPGWEGTVGKGEPPRKRGRPSKAESERRKAEAQARGEEYPPRRRSTTTKAKNPPTPSGAASVTNEASILSPRAVIHTPEMHKQELPSEMPGGKDSGRLRPSMRRASESSITEEAIDPVRGIIRSQASQERKLPPPLELEAGRGFVSQSPPREAFFPPPRALEVPFTGGPPAHQVGGIMHSAADQPSISQTNPIPHIDTSAGPMPSMSRPGETKT